VNPEFPVSNQSLRPRLAVLTAGVAATTGLSLIALHGWTALASAALGILMVAGADIDARSFVLPNILTAATFLSGLLFALVLNPHDAELALAAAVIRAFATAAVLALVRWGYRQLRDREGLGLGDVKLAFGIGAWLPADLIPACFALAAATALLVILLAHSRGKIIDAGTKLPFGAFLCPALWLMFYVDALGDWLGVH
jgi:leader peptidase (prepilin peptidase)/N-methyltransferase